jgi:hypothetical protein
MKIAVCLSGQTRTFDYCVESIKSFFKDCDFFCHTYNYNSYHEAGVKPIHDIWREDIIKLIKENLKPKKLKVETREQTTKMFETMGWDKDEETLNNYSMYHSIIESYDYDFSDYDIVVKSRYDLIHKPNTTIYDFIPNNTGYNFFLNDFIDEENEFACNDAQWITDSKTAKIIYNFKEITNKKFITNKVFLDYLLSNNVQTKIIEQSWELVRPRFTKLESNWEKLFKLYHHILKDDPYTLPGKSVEYFKRNSV